MNSIDIIAEATKILQSPPVIPPDSRGWAHWWCPFHGDSLRAGRGGRPNFGINIEIGYYKCLRCGESGPSLSYLSHKLGKGWRPDLSQAAAMDSYAGREVPKSKVNQLDEALSAARSALLTSPAIPYLQERGVKQYTALVYGLAYGQPSPYISKETALSAYESKLVLRNGIWLWAGGVVYADPINKPTVLNVRYIPDERLPAGTRPFPIEENHHTWGVRQAPLGSWRITSSTRVLLVVEGLFDMLVGAQTVGERHLHPEVVTVYTNGASPVYRMLDWFTANATNYDFVLIPDQDKAGLGGWDEVKQKNVLGWLQHITGAIDKGGGRHCVINTPNGLDPDEAFLSGWWPSII
jgi:hypothetical protein